MITPWIIGQVIKQPTTPKEANKLHHIVGCALQNGNWVDTISTPKRFTVTMHVSNTGRASCIG